MCKAYSLKALFIAISVVAMGLYVLCTILIPGWNQHVAIASIREYPSIVRYDYEIDVSKERSGAKLWLSRFIGDEYLFSVESVCAGGRVRVTDEELQRISKLTRLKVLRIGGASVTDDGMQYLTRLTVLRELNLSGTQITDAGIVHLKGLSNLQKLNLRGTGITDAAVAHLKDIGSLESLNVKETRITAEGVGALQTSLPRCYIYWDDNVGLRGGQTH